ncbi:hypothetical protein [Acetobacter sp. DmW_043]|uniref:hypothetical protein n=1 Tax=Acetobacter sp. DmW_043 TaxID=1670658 RepID=UPI00117743CC|nr:hypothetical protein [Acetobacter sp. DmW_043]
MEFILPLDEGEWSSLSKKFNSGVDNHLLSSLIGKFRSAGCVSILEESPYIDRDFSEAFFHFYSGLFRPLTKYCRRLHFFSDDLSDILKCTTPGDMVLKLEKYKNNYLGDIVVRPLPHAPVSSARLSVSQGIQSDTQKICVKSSHKSHLLGVEFETSSFPLTQQDTRTGACAQAAIWMAGRHFYSRHSAPWFSLPQITAAALNPTDSGITRSLPAGSEYLTADNMVRALRAMGRHPVTYVPDAIVDGQRTWSNLKPEEVIARYVDSGIPVILGLCQKDTSIGHAVVAIGVERGLSEDCKTSSLEPTTADFYTHFLVNDDQRGVYCRLPILEENSTEEYPFVLNRDIKFILVPLPGKVFLTAEAAEVVARDTINSLSKNRFDLSQQSLQTGEKWDENPDFYKEVDNEKIVSRTYLTYGWKYKSRMLRNASSDNLKRILLRTQFPKYVWVTEFSEYATSKNLDPCLRRIQSHVVIDATGSRFWESRLIAHTPGLLYSWQYNSDGTTEGCVDAYISSKSYWPKIGGAKDYSACEIDH